MLQPTGALRGLNVQCESLVHAEKLLRGALSKDTKFAGLVPESWKLVPGMNTLPTDYGIGVTDIGTDVRG